MTDVGPVVEMECVNEETILGSIFCSWVCSLGPSHQFLGVPPWQ